MLDTNALRRQLAPTKTERALSDCYRDDVERLCLKWQQEASEQALAGNPTRAQYIEEHWLRPALRAVGLR